MPKNNAMAKTIFNLKIERLDPCFLIKPIKINHCNMLGYPVAGVLPGMDQVVCTTTMLMKGWRSGIHLHNNRISTTNIQHPGSFIVLNFEIIKRNKTCITVCSNVLLYVLE